MVFMPLALVISLLINGPALWSAYNYPQIDLWGILLSFAIIAILLAFALNWANRTMARYLGNPVIDLRGGEDDADEEPPLRAQGDVVEGRVVPELGATDEVSGRLPADPLEASEQTATAAEETIRAAQGTLAPPATPPMPAASGGPVTEAGGQERAAELATAGPSEG